MKRVKMVKLTANLIMAAGILAAALLPNACGEFFNDAFDSYSSAPDMVSNVGITFPKVKGTKNEAVVSWVSPENASGVTIKFDTLDVQTLALAKSETNIIFGYGSTTSFDLPDDYPDFKYRVTILTINSLGERSEAVVLEAVPPSPTQE